MADQAVTRAGRVPATSRSARASRPVSCPTQAIRMASRERARRVLEGLGQRRAGIEQRDDVQHPPLGPPPNWSAKAEMAGASGMSRSAAIARSESSAS